MKHAKHTPGPWTARLTKADCTYAIECNLSHRKHSSTEERIGTLVALNDANAQLIAAAPEIYAAGQDLIDWLHEFVGQDAWQEIIGAKPNTVAVRSVADMLAALSKARGES